MILKTLQIIILDNMRYISTFIFEKKKKKKHVRDGTGEGRATSPSFLQSKDRRF